jgi:peptidoglycan/LPS O-acetylase OafA/YrhL
VAKVEQPEIDQSAAGAGGPIRVLRRVPEFDGVRAVAVLLVVWFHSGLLRALPTNAKPTGGFLGVDMFFVLSGFLITALLLNEQARRGRIHFGAFYRRRAMRLLPVITAFVIAHVVFAHVVHIPAARERSSILSTVLYYTNWQATHSVLAPAFGHLWSLAVEEQFYIVWPMAVTILTIRARLRTVVLVLGTAIVVVAVRRALMYEHGASVTRLLGGTDTRADTLLSGALLAHLWVRRELRFRGLELAGWLSVAFLAVCVWRVRYTSGFLYHGGLTLIALAVAVALTAILDSNWSPKRLLRLRPLQQIGRVSYGLYVWHPLAFTWSGYYTRHWRAAPRFVVGIAATALTVFLSWTLIEEPFLNWKRRLEGRAAERET